VEGSLIAMNHESTSPEWSNMIIQQYRDCGFVVVRDFFERSRQAEWVNECERLSGILAAAEAGNPRFHGRTHLTLGHIFDRIDPVIDLSPVFQRIAHDASLAGACGQLIGEPAALFKDKLIAKPPGTFGYLIHQDYPYWEHLGIPADLMLTAWVAIDRADEENGALELFPGLHHARIPGTPDAPMDVDETRVDTSSGVIIAMEPGDVLFFHSMAPHRSSPNRSNRHRRSLLLTFVPERFDYLYDQYYRKKLH